MYRFIHLIGWIRLKLSKMSNYQSSQSALGLGCSDWCGLPLNASGRISEQAEQAFSFHSKGGRCNFWGLFRCNDRSRDGWRHDRNRSDTIMISKLCRFGYIFHHECFVLFCFWTLDYIYHTNVSCDWVSLPYASLQSNWASKPLKLGLSISFSLWWFSSLLTL